MWREVTIGRNSTFRHLSSEDRDELGGIEYKSLKLLLKIIIGRYRSALSIGTRLMRIGYYVFLHLLGAVCLIGWIRHAPSKYVDYIAEVGQNSIWW